MSEYDPTALGDEPGADERFEHPPGPTDPAAVDDDLPDPDDGPLDVPAEDAPDTDVPEPDDDGNEEPPDGE